jgi:hypothetical protein
VEEVYAGSASFSCIARIENYLLSSHSQTLHLKIGQKAAHKTGVVKFLLLTSVSCAGDGRTVFDLQRDQEDRRQKRKHELQQQGRPQSALNSTELNDTGTEAVGLFDDISKWQKAHSYECFQEKNSMESGSLFQLIEKDVFSGGQKAVTQGFLRAMLLAEDVLVNGNNRPWDKVQITPEGLQAAVLNCCRACYSSCSELDDIRRQVYDSAWVRSYCLNRHDKPSQLLWNASEMFLKIAASHYSKLCNMYCFALRACSACYVCVMQSSGGTQGAR